MAATAPTSRVLIVSSFVLPRRGGVEQFVDIATQLLQAHGCRVRVLACRPRKGAAVADATVPSWFLRANGWPLPVGGWRTLWREVGSTDVVVANGARHLLPGLATVTARLRRKRVLFILHGSGAPFSTGSFIYHRLLGRVFERLITRPVLRLSQPVSLSRAGVAGARGRYGVTAAYVPFPLRDLPPARPRFLDVDEPIKIVWVGRLFREKNPLGAVAVVDEVIRQRAARLEIYGDGFQRDELEQLARDRAWLAVREGRSWGEVQRLQDAAHVCLSTSLRDATQIAILEPLARGIPVVSTRVGDAPHYYPAELGAFCLSAGDPGAAAAAILELASSYERYVEQFAANADRLGRVHREGRERLATLVDTASNGRS
jgi:glycosyltransferase involved in cell wall biosynthesis